MMHGVEKSDPAVVAVKPANKAVHLSSGAAAEWVEPRAGTEGNAAQDHTRRTQSRCSVSQGLDRVRQAARLRKKEKFTALMHHVTVQALREAYMALKRHAAAGVDGVTWQDYGVELETKLLELHRQVQRGTYRALPVKRRFIAKQDGKLRPLGITALEDKIVQRAVGTVLEAVYEADFMEFSYGFRPGRSQHDALDALSVEITQARVNWILDADIRSFFDKIDQTWLIKFLKHRIGDGRVIRLVCKWLKAGVVEEGTWSTSETGTPQGAVISPLLANVFLHYVYDLWVLQWRQRHAKGQMITVRYADDVVAGFELEADARAFWDAMRQRFKQFALELHEDKTRLLEFGRFAAARRARRGQGKTETFKFLGLRLHLRQDAARGLPASAQNAQRPHANEAAGHQGEAAPAHARQHSRTREVAASGGQRLFCVPRGAHQLPGTGVIPTTRHRPVAAHAEAAQPERQADAEANGRHREHLAAPSSHPSSLAQRPTCRQTPEVGAECVNRACSDLCGGHSAMGVPTAIPAARTRGRGAMG